MQDSIHIKAANGSLVIISTNEESISLGIGIRGASVRIDLTPEQAHELINAITQTLNKETTE